MIRIVKGNIKETGKKNSKEYSKKWLEIMKKATIAPPLLLATTTTVWQTRSRIDIDGF